MASRTCMNLSCGTSTTTRWHRGWALRSGQFADLCDNCASVYDQSTFCDVFHCNDSGWRECNSCGKRLHCGCIVSISLVDLLDTGGINCRKCSKYSRLQPIDNNGKPDGSSTSKVENTCSLQCSSLDDQFIELKNMKLGTTMEYNGFQHVLHPPINETNGSFTKMKQEEILPPAREFGSTSLSIFSHASSGLYNGSKEDIKRNVGIRDMHDSLVQTNLAMTLGAPFENSFNVAHVDETEQNRASPILGQRSRHLLPKPPRSTLLTNLDSNAEMVTQMRIARPPAEGRGRNQLLPRYWPRITDQELQQLSGDSNSTIVPLFEKMLSASDAGRIGRLVLPKACAEAYFPPISQPEGLPLRIQDVKGKEWVFQFRFWPNNNSRMYVLEGVTACIQSMQLQAGDTVTFSRMDPEGKLIMGFRKASNSAALQSLKGSGDPDLNMLSSHWSSATINIDWHNVEKSEDRTREGLMLPPGLAPEKKKARNIGSKSKRLHIDCHDALELKLTWEEVQELLRPPLMANPSAVTIEDHLFEEFEEPPIFGKRSIFAVRSNGVQEQWAQCDTCSKWRRLPIDILLPPKWTCADNSSDPGRCSCSAPDELTPRELDNLLRLNKEFRKWKMAACHGSTIECESSGIDALAGAAILGENVGDSGTSSGAMTTKHPRHRPGCSCIVCIQPPSGKGKHKPTCTCNVCMTVKRRFKTLMMRKKKRQSEREAEIIEKTQLSCCPRDETEAESTSRHVVPPLQNSEDQTRAVNDILLRSQSNSTGTSKGQLDLNYHPNREEKKPVSNCVSMMCLLQEASLPLDTYLKENGLTSLMSEQEADSASDLLLPATNRSDGQQNENLCPASFAQEEESGEENNEPDKSENDPV